MTEEIRTERRAGALWIVVDRPAARNAMTFAMYDRIAAICRDANADGSVKAVVISGAGDAFVAGTDIAQFVDFKEAAQALEYERRMDAWLGAIEDVRVPTIAALRGPVVGGGLAIAAACDLRVAAPSARFGVPVARTLGNCFSAANLVRLAALVGVAVVTIVEVVAGRPAEVWLIVVGPLVVLVVAVLLSLSHLDVDVTDEGVTIAFRYVWPARHIGFSEIVGLEVRRYDPLLEYGGWGVRLGPKGWGYMTSGNEGVQLRLRKGLPVLIGSRRPRELEAAIRAGAEGASRM